MRVTRIGPAVAGLLLVVGLLPPAGAAGASGATELVSRASDGTPGNGESGLGDGMGVSLDGRFVVFTSYANNLVPGDTNGLPDVFVRDRTLGTTELVSLATDGAQSNGVSTRGSISDDGRYVAFTSTGTNLGGSNSQNDVYVRDRTLGTTSWIAAGFDGKLSGDGSRIAYTTLPEPRQIYTQPTGGGPAELVTVAAAGGASNDPHNAPSLTHVGATGRFIMFTSSATDLSAVPIDRQQHVWLRDRVAGTTTLVDRDGSGQPADGPSGRGRVTADGQTVAFWSYANLDGAPVNTDGYFVRDLPNGAPVRVGSGVTNSIDISADGRFVAFDSFAANGTLDTTANRADVFRVDRLAGTTEIVNVDNAGTQGPFGSLLPAISGDGTTVVMSAGDALTADDTNSQQDVFVRVFPPATTVTAVSPDAPTGVTATARDGRATISWTAPPSDGGSPITTYTVTANPSGASRSVGAASTPVSLNGLMNGTSYTFTVTATNYVGTGPSSPPSNAVTPAVAFVTANSTRLELDEQPFTFTGMNIYNANSDDWCANNMDNGKLETALSEIGLGGIHGGDRGVIRAWFFQPLATLQFSGARDWTRFDRTLAAAKAAGYHVIPTLGNQWGECGHKGPTAGYKTPAWYQTGYTQLQPEDSVYATYSSYRDWVAEVVARYKDDPTVLAWQLLNEAETNPDWPNACPPGPAPFDALHGWAADVSALIKSIDPNHLVSLGTIGSGQCGTSGPQYKDLHALPDIDLCEFHDYDPWTAMPGDQWNGLALRIQQCNELDKPLFIGEVGLRPVDIGGSFESRVASLRAKLLAQRGQGIVGHLVWNWGPGPSALDAYDIGPGDPILRLLAGAPSFPDPETPFDSDWVAPFITLNAPNRSLYTLNEPLTASFSCSEVGTSGLASCDGTLPSGSTIDTSTPGTFTFTVTTTDNLGNHRSVTQAYDVTAGDISTSVPPDASATVTTDPGGVGASAAVPIQTSVQFTAPSGSPTPVSIDLHPPTIGAPSGYAILGNEVDIDLGGLTRPASDPIVITFVVDSTTGVTPTTVTVSRTNADTSTDIALPCDAVPAASPDPCYVAAYTAGVGSDVRVTIYTTHASQWLALRRTDLSPPVITSTVTGTLGSDGWYRSNVGISWTRTDAQSAILTSSGCGPATIGIDTAGTTLTCSATSAGGTSMEAVSVKRDASPPDLTCVGASFVLGATGARVSATVSDAVSGPVATTVFADANTSSVGRKTASLTGLDRAGNSAEATCSYVVGYALTNLKPTPGFVARRGSSIGVQFMLRDSANRPISDTAARSIVSACTAKILFSAGNPSPNCARYDDKVDTFLFDLKTSKTMPVGSYTVTIQVSSGADVVTSALVAVEIRQ